MSKDPKKHDLLPTPTPGRVEISKGDADEALAGASAAVAEAMAAGGGGGLGGEGGAGGMMAEFLSPYEAEHFIQELRTFTLEEVGGREWMAQHERLERLNFQAHQSAKAHSDEFILEAVLTFDKLETLVHDLLLIEAWREEVFPRLAARVPEKAASKCYFVLYHEATVLNLLEVFLYHEHAAEAMGEALLELIDYCMRKIVRLHCRPRDEVEKVFFVPAKELAAQLERESVEEGLLRHRRRIDFSVGVTTASVLRCICGHASKECMPVGVLTRLLDTHDCIVALVPLIEYPPWTFRNAAGKWFKYEEQKWVATEPEDLLKLTKTEGQMWLSLFHLMCDGECRKRYVFNGFRKEQVLRVRKYLNDVMLDQLPVLADVQRYMDELAIMQTPSAHDAAGGKSALLMECVPVLRAGIVGRRGEAEWAAVADGALAGAFDEATATTEMKSLAALYSMDGVEELMDTAGAGGVAASNLAEKHAHLVTVSVTVIGIDGKELAGVPAAHYRWDGQPEVVSVAEGGAEWARRKVVRVAADGTDWATPPCDDARVPFDATVRVRAIFASGATAELDSESLALPTFSHKTRSPAEASGRVAVPVPAEGEGALPKAQWRQIGSLTTTEQIVQVQLLRAENTKSTVKDPAAPQHVLLNGYTLGTVFVSTMMKRAPQQEADKILAGLQGSGSKVQELS
jgi:zinc finger MYND domain-containing protein 10